MSSHIVIAATLCASLCGPAQIDVWDGDTFRLGSERVRIVNIDAPEVGDGAKCAYEAMLGIDAKVALAELLSSGDVEINRDGKDRYGRTLAVVTVDGIDVGVQLIRIGVARPWAGRRESWC